VIEWSKKSLEERARHIEMFAAAVLKKMGLPPELVEQQRWDDDGMTIRWWFRTSTGSGSVRWRERRLSADSSDERR
jgi:hypothetical protein